MKAELKWVRVVAESLRGRERRALKKRGKSWKKVREEL